MKVFIINGHGGAGKDLFINYFTEFAGKNYVLNISTVDYVKKIASQLGWVGEKDDTSRLYLHQLKEMATYWADIPFTQACKAVTTFNDELTSYGVVNKGFVFIHCREPKEISRLIYALSNMGYEAYAILIRRPIDKIYGNYADDNVENYSYDFVIENDGTLDDLKILAEDFYENNR